MNLDVVFEPDWFSKPGDSLLQAMERRNVTLDEIAPKISGGEELLRNIFDGSAAIDTEVASELVEYIGGTVHYWLKRQTNYESALDQAVIEAADCEPDLWLDKVPDPSPKTPCNKGDLELHTELRRRLRFFNVPTYQGWFDQYGQYAAETPFRESKTFESYDSSNLLWLRRGELEAEAVSTKKWDPSALKDQLPEIRKLTKISKPSRFLPLLKQLLASVGVALAVVRAPTGCRACGATRMISTDKAMLLVSFRHRSDDQFWFTVFHEIGHLLLHGAQTFVDFDETPDRDIEREANQFARECIIPEDAMDAFSSLALNRNAVLRFALSVGISPGLIVGQLQHREMIAYNRLNSLKRRWNWQDINAVLV